LLYNFFKYKTNIRIEKYYFFVFSEIARDKFLRIQSFYRSFKGNSTNWHFFPKSNAIDIEFAKETAISDISIEYITQTANAKTEFMPLCRSFRLVKYGQWFVDQIDFTYVRIYGLVRAATSCRWVCRYSLNRHPCTSVGQTIIDIGGAVLVKHHTYVLH